jgi:hypothetical protein
MNIHERHGNNIKSSNWSGYAVADLSSPVTDVTASWTVPSVTSCPLTGNQYASFWVGIDGFSSNTVEQIGTDSDCQNGQEVYYAWYEFYPHFSYNINLFSITPGDRMSAKVTADAKGNFTLTITDESLLRVPNSFTISKKIPSAARSSAEWIAEAPSSGGGVLPLADFATVSYGLDYTGIANTCNATIGTAGAIGSFPAANVYNIVMEDSNSTTKKAVPSQLSSDSSSFSINWMATGP